MIVELAIAGGITYLWNWMNTKEERKIKKRWINIMQSMGIKNKFDQTFEIFNIKPTSYGFNMYLNVPYGLSKSLLEERINVLSDNLNGIVELEKDKFKPYIIMRVVDKDLDKFLFKPVKCPSHKLWTGKDFKGANHFIDLNKDPMILIGGATGSGKSFLLACMLANLIYNSSDDIVLYLSQIVKGEISLFANCKPVKRVDTSTEEANVTLNKICRIFKERSELFTRHGVKNISQWNKHFPNQRKKRIFYIIEEISFYMDDMEIWGYMALLIKAGRSVGIHIISVLQRSTSDQILPIIKSQMTRITAKQRSTIDSINIIGVADAIKLKNREFLVDGNDGLQLIKTPYIDEDYVILNRFVLEIMIPTKESKQEIINVKKELDQIVITSIPNIIEIPENEIEDIQPKTYLKISDKPQKRSSREKGVITLEEYLRRRKGE